MNVWAGLTVLGLARLSTAFQLRVPEEPRQAVKHDSCNGTVAYAFITRNDLPLWPVWKEYFDGCPKGSFTVIVHTQHPGNASVVSSVGGEEMRASETIYGGLRFDYKMVDVMLNLYGGVKMHGAAPNGCAPTWVHMSSEHCAPVEPCSKVHAHLEQNAGNSFVKRVPEDKFTTQWITLWAEHAFSLWKDRKKMRSEWARRMNYTGRTTVHINGEDTYLPVDSLIWPLELKTRGLLMHHQNRSLTFNHFSDDKGHADIAHTASDARYLVQKAHDHESLFARKFEATPETLRVLSKNLKD